MKKITTLLAVLAVMSVAGPAVANHCDANLSNVDSAAASTNAESSVIQAAAAVVEQAMDVCDAEQAQFAAQGAASPLTDPAFVSGGQSMLIAAARLLSGN